MIFLGNAIRSFTTGYVESIKDRLEYIVDFMYGSSEPLNEEKSCGLLCDIFSSEGFDIKRNISDINNSFRSSFGNGSPTIAYICNYGCDKQSLSRYSHNFTCAISTGAALGLKRAIGEVGGKVVVFGCPSDSKIEMLNKGEFNDINAIICGHASYKTSESGSSLGCKTIDFIFKRKKSNSTIEAPSISNAISPCTLLFNLSELLKANYPGKVIINGVIKNIMNSADLITEETECSFSVKGLQENIIDFVSNELIDCAKFSGKMYECNVSYSQSKNKYIPLKTHSELSKIACHNLKECGIINIHAPITISDGIDIGAISAVIPTINPGIGISEKEVQLNYDDFNKRAKSPYAKENMIKAACAFALTGVDVIQSPDILNIQQVAFDS